MITSASNEDEGYKEYSVRVAESATAEGEDTTMTVLSELVLDLSMSCLTSSYINNR